MLYFALESKLLVNQGVLKQFFAGHQDPKTWIFNFFWIVALCFWKNRIIIQLKKIPFRLFFLPGLHHLCGSFDLSEFSEWGKGEKGRDRRIESVSEREKRQEQREWATYGEKEWSKEISETQREDKKEWDSVKCEIVCVHLSGCVRERERLERQK